MIIDSIDALQLLSNDLKSQKKKIVRTNGCFDILHPGHITSIEQAKKCGDVLVVGINSDKSPYWKTKPNRPINDQYFRSHMMDAIKYVDYVILFDEETPIEWIKALVPDVLVKGGDYTDVTKIVGYDIVVGHGGQVLSIPLAETSGSPYSTTGIIAKIKSLP